MVNILIVILIFLIIAFVVIRCYYLLLCKEEKEIDRQIAIEKIRLTVLKEELDRRIKEMDNGRNSC